KALASVTFDDAFVVHDIKIVDTNNRFYIVMPSKKKTEGVYRDICHPVSSEFRAVIEKAVLAEYEAELTRKQEELRLQAEAAAAPDARPEEDEL
ncbi:MAG: SpoVG family protein, partial [Clostridia bacterium]|nr:SpoVG family protein [Clostridia bacterium]